ncbi:MAG: polysaccharide deacetylase family protein [Isosphaeraceae bacterium]
MSPAPDSSVHRRGFLNSLAAGAAAGSVRRAHGAGTAPADQALVAITLDLEMSRNFPTWEQTHWDYEKGNLDAATKAYAVEAARRVKARGGLVHFFALGQTMEQADVGWLRDIAREGHPIGNHTYDHVNVTATRLEDLQFRFRRAPWLVEGKTAAEAVAANVRMGHRALAQRLGIEPAGFRTPGGFHDGLSDRPDVQAMLLKLGYRWVSSKYPAHPLGQPGKPCDPATLSAIVEALAQAQPFAYPSGLIEVPMSPVSDVTAFRSGRWPLESFVEATRAAVTRAIERRAVFCFLAHPSCLVATDPRFRAIDAICELVSAARDRCAIVDLDAVARRAGSQPKAK